jgi:hypothetical protein
MNVFCDYTHPRISHYAYMQIFQNPKTKKGKSETLWVWSIADQASSTCV